MAVVAVVVIEYMSSSMMIHVRIPLTSKSFSDLLYHKKTNMN